MTADPRHAAIETMIVRGSHEGTLRRPAWWTRTLYRRLARANPFEPSVDRAWADLNASQLDRAIETEVAAAFSVSRRELPAVAGRLAALALLAERCEAAMRVDPELRLGDAALLVTGEGEA